MRLQKTRYALACSMTFDPKLPDQNRDNGATLVPDSHTWRRTTLGQRAMVAVRAAAILRARADEFAQPVHNETGKVIEEARAEVALGAEIIDAYARVAVAPAAAGDDRARSAEPSLEGRPLLFCVLPANCSYDQLARLSAPNLLAGNIVMVKHTGAVPRAAIAFEQLWLEAGAPVGAFANLLIAYD